MGKIVDCNYRLHFSAIERILSHIIKCIDEDMNFVYQLLEREVIGCKLPKLEHIIYYLLSSEREQSFVGTSPLASLELRLTF